MTRHIAAAASILAACASSSPHAHDGPGHHDHDMPHHFDDPAKWSAVFDDPARDAWQRPDEVVARLEIAPGAVVVDVGAGTGYFEARLARAVGASGKVIALDVEPSMVKWMTDRFAREHLDVVEARVCAPDDPGLAPGSVDRVLVVDTWHHLPDRDAYAKKLAAALRPKGLVAVVDFTLTSSMGPPPEHRVAPEIVRDVLAAAGLDASIGPPLTEQYVVIGRRP